MVFDAGSIRTRRPAATTPSVSPTVVQVGPIVGSITPEAMIAVPKVSSAGTFQPNRRQRPRRSCPVVTKSPGSGCATVRGRRPDVDRVQSLGHRAWDSIVDRAAHPTSAPVIDTRLLTGRGA